jgi:hypothetical protein
VLLWAVAVTTATVWTCWSTSKAHALQQPGNLNDFTWAILNAGGQSYRGGLAHLYAGDGSILVALPGFQLFLVFLVRVLGWFGARPPADHLVLLHGRAGYAAVGVAWPVMELISYALAFATIVPLATLARRCGVTGWRLAAFLLSASGALWWMSVDWGHPDDTIALGLLALAADRMLDHRAAGAAWLLGVGFAVQPLVVLAAPLLLVLEPARRWLVLLVRMATPGLVALSIPLIGDPRDTLRQVVDQPTYPRVGHPTPWTALVPHPQAGVVYAGWPRSVGVLLAVAVALLLARRVRRQGAVAPSELVWLMAACLTLRCLFESVLFPYYVVPPLVFALLALARRHPSVGMVGLIAAAAAGYVGGLRMDSTLLYWLAVVGCLVAALACGAPVWRRRPALADPPGQTVSSAAVDERLAVSA